QPFREESGPARTSSCGASLDLGECVAANLLGVVAGEERGSRRPAAGGVIELSEAESFVSQLVEVRGGDFAAVTAEVGIAEVVGEDDEDVGTSLFVLGGEQE